MSIQQQMNQFGMLPIKGNIAAIVNPVTLSAVIDPASAYNTYANAIVAGDVVYLTNSTGNAILVDKSNTSTKLFGVVLASPKRDKFIGGDPVEVALPGSVVFMEGVNTIGRGDYVEFMAALSAVQTCASNTANTIVGVSLDKSAANSTAVRIWIGKQL